MSDRASSVALVSGAGDGIGRALALRLAELHLVLAVDIRGDAARDVANEIRSRGGEAEGLECDVSDREATHAVAESVHRRHGALTQLWAHAGVGIAGGLVGARERSLDWLLSVNVWGTLHTLRAFVPEMTAQAGKRHVIITASSVSLGPIDASLAAYGASKHMSLAIAEGLRAELAGSHVGVSVLCPGLTNTRIWNAGRARPRRFGGPASVPDHVGGRWAQGLSPEHVAEKAMAGVGSGRFYIIVPAAGTPTTFAERTREIEEAFCDQIHR